MRRLEAHFRVGAPPCLDLRQLAFRAGAEPLLRRRREGGDASAHIGRRGDPVREQRGRGKLGKVLPDLFRMAEMHVFAPFARRSLCTGSAESQNHRQRQWETTQCLGSGIARFCQRCSANRAGCVPSRTGLQRGRRTGALSSRDGGRVGAGRDAVFAHEQPRHVALVGEAAGGRCVRQRLPPPISCRARSIRRWIR